MVTRADVSTAPRPGAPQAAPRPGRRMVRWYDPLLLAKTGVKAVVSATIGKQADRRLLDALANPQPTFFDYSIGVDGRARDELWLDYVADVGDGWDSTYAIALALSRPSLALQDGEGRTYQTHRGEVLLFGGDGVYPTADVAAYEERTLRPYEAALRGTLYTDGATRPPPHLFAIPGNHDWYDGLVSFIRLFCQERLLTGRQTRQRRSYFALKLPQGWWLLGTDMQLESDIDEPQVRYFESVAKEMREGDRVILCNAEPAWVYAQVKPTAKRAHLENNLDFLQEHVLEKKVTVFLAGDLHHYRRHADAEGRQKIVAGGGGAFLHPTHLPRRDTSPGGFVLQKAFPSPEVSRRLCWRNLGFLRFNPRFGLATGLLYLLLAWPLALEAGAAEVPLSFSFLLQKAFESPGYLLGAAITLLALMGFADARFKRWRWLAGLLHGLAHLTAAFMITWGVSRLVLMVPPPGPWRELLGGLLTFAGGWLVGPTLMGLYLLVSLNRFGCHPNEAFSSLAIPDWKSFLRLRIDREGRLWIFPVGIRRVPRSWRPGSTAREPEWVPDPADRAATPPALIEPPIAAGSPRARASPPHTS